VDFLFLMIMQQIRDHYRHLHEQSPFLTAASIT